MAQAFHKNSRGERGQEDASLNTHGTPKSYTIGFALSLALTIEAYLLVVSHTFSAPVLMIIILVLAILQLLVQLFYFLHLDRAAKTPWNIIVLLFMGLVVAIVVFGSLWIMKNLSYHMSPHETDTYIQNEEGIKK